VTKAAELQRAAAATRTLFPNGINCDTRTTSAKNVQSERRLWIIPSSLPGLPGEKRAAVGGIPAYFIISKSVGGNIFNVLQNYRLSKTVMKWSFLV
jgi:hypothetical protein